jgi:uncharacterized membrane protein (UPF0127 family)
MNIIAEYSDFSFYKNPFYTLEFGNQILVLNEHFNVPENQIEEMISSYSDEHTFLKNFMNRPKLIKNNKIILADMEEAKTPEAARNGLLGRSNILRGQGLLIYNCSAIHMIGMQFPINTYFLDSGFNVIAQFKNIPVGSWTPYIHGARYALETGVFPYDICIGDKLDILSFNFTELE